jgi:hypothetical protein
MESGSGSGSSSGGGENDGEQQHHLTWSDRQGRILTANGRAAKYWSAVPFEEADLPHYWLERNETRQSFDSWKAGDLARISLTDRVDSGAIIVGAWCRTVFFGEWDFSSHKDEHVYNLQSRTLFVDLRIPRSRLEAVVFGSSDRYSSIQSVQDLRRGQELRWYARQHVFAGYSRLTATAEEKEKVAGVSIGAGMISSCVRHHCLDWNYVGVRRPVPNQWWIQVHPDNRDVWREWAYPTNDIRHHYYGEEWKRLVPSSRSNVGKIELEVGVVAFRKRIAADEDEDGVLVIVGDHFNYCVGRPLVRRGTGGAAAARNDDDDAVPYGASSLVELVDRAVAGGDLDTARAWLDRIQGGHGRVSAGWTIDCAIEFWKEGTRFWSSSLSEEEPVRLVGDSVDACVIVHGRDEWTVFECNIPSIQSLKSFLRLPRTAETEIASVQHRGEAKRLRAL